LSVGFLQRLLLNSLSLFLNRADCSEVSSFKSGFANQSSILEIIAPSTHLTQSIELANHNTHLFCQASNTACILSSGTSKLEPSLR